MNSAKNQFNSEATFIELVAKNYQKYEEIDLDLKGLREKIILNNNIPYYTEINLQNCMGHLGESYYAPLDDLGRCVVACALVGKELLPNCCRRSIGTVKPTGWKNIRYACVPGKYCFNRCHLIGYQLTGENANRCNLITGTRRLNVDSNNGMLTFENEVKEYVCRTGNHVLYRVVPRFYQDNLLADGVTMEALSLEDNSICFNVFIPNCQDGIWIEYKSGYTKEL